MADRGGAGASQAQTGKKRAQDHGGRTGQGSNKMVKGGGGRPSGSASASGSRQSTATIDEQATLERAIHDPDYFRELVSRRKPMEADVDLAAREEQLKAEYAIIAGSGERTEEAKEDLKLWLEAMSSNLRRISQRGHWRGTNTRD